MAEMKLGAMHEALKPLTWLMGRWKSIKAEGSYPTIKPFEYCEELSFESVGQPMLNYTSNTWHPVKENPMHLERGFLRIKPGTNEVSFMVAHNFGLTTLEEGCVNNNELHVKSKQISRMSFAKDPAVLGLERTFKLLENGNLEMVALMETTNTPLTLHLKTVYKKICN